MRHYCVLSEGVECVLSQSSRQPRSGGQKLDAAAKLRVKEHLYVAKEDFGNIKPSSKGQFDWPKTLMDKIKQPWTVSHIMQRAYLRKKAVSSDQDSTMHTIFDIEHIEVDIGDGIQYDTIDYSLPDPNNSTRFIRSLEALTDEVKK